MSTTHECRNAKSKPFPSISRGRGPPVGLTQNNYICMQRSHMAATLSITDARMFISNSRLCFLSILINICLFDTNKQELLAVGLLIQA